MGDLKKYSFGKRKRTHKRSRKPPMSLLRRCKKYHIKTTKKIGKHRVYRSVGLLKKLLNKKLKKLKKHRKVKKRSHRRSHRRVRRSGFGESIGSEFLQPSDYGYNQPVNQYPGTLDQTISTVTDENNMSRPEGFNLDRQSIPTYGVYRDFFGEKVPTQVPPNYNFMGQPDGTLIPTGTPFQRYTTPPGAFGKRKYRRKGRRYNVAGSNCNKLKKRVCRSNPNCSYTRRGCRRRKGTATKSVVYEGPSLEFGKRRRRRYNVAGSPCNGLEKRVCVSSANCRYTKRGCRRRSKTMVYEGPSLAFGRKRRKVHRRRRRYNVPGSPCNKLKKRVCVSSPNCRYTKRGCRRRSKSMVYEGPSLAFGRKRRKVHRRRRRYNVPGSPCNKLKKRVCVSSANCRYTKRGCRRRSKSMVYEGPSLEFGRRRPRRYRRYNVPGSPCNKLKKRVCVSSPNCRYTKRGCRRRSKSMVYEGPSLAFGKRRRRKVRRKVRRVSRRRPVRRYRRRVSRRRI
jgi:hypothetical protein